MSQRMVSHLSSDQLINQLIAWLSFDSTYCKTRFARGKLGSYPIHDIVQRAKQSFEEGVKEIWLTSEDTGAYGRDIGTNLPELMYALISVIPEDCRLRLGIQCLLSVVILTLIVWTGMTNPPYILEHMDAMADVTTIC